MNLQVTPTGRLVLTNSFFEMMHRKTPYTTLTADVRRSLSLSISLHFGDCRQDSSGYGLVRPSARCGHLPSDFVARTGTLDVNINDWQAAGLLKPSVARLDRIVTAEKSVFIRRLGILSTRDMDAIRKIWNAHMTL